MLTGAEIQYNSVFDMCGSVLADKQNVLRNLAKTETAHCSVFLRLAIPVQLTTDFTSRSISYSFPFILNRTCSLERLIFSIFP